MAGRMHEVYTLDLYVKYSEGYSGELFVMSNLPRTAARPHER